MSDDPERHSLKPDELRAVYNNLVAPGLFANTKGVERPTAVILGGQPGTGKAPTQEQAAHEPAGSGG